MKYSNEVCRQAYELYQHFREADCPDPLEKAGIREALEWLIEADPDDADIHRFNLAAICYEEEDYAGVLKAFQTDSQSVNPDLGATASALIVKSLLQPDWDGYNEKTALAVCEQFPADRWCRLLQAVILKNGQSAEEKTSEEKTVRTQTAKVQSGGMPDKSGTGKDRPAGKEGRTASWRILCDLITEMEEEPILFSFPYAPYPEAAALYGSFLREYYPDYHSVLLHDMFGRAMKLLDARGDIHASSKDDQLVRSALQSWADACGFPGR